MLDETKHQSYYDVYMQANPKDQIQTLIDSLIKEFAEDLKKYDINVLDRVKGDDIDGIKLEEA